MSELVEYPLDGHVFPPLTVDVLRRGSRCVCICLSGATGGSWTLQRQIVKLAEVFAEQRGGGGGGNLYTPPPPPYTHSRESSLERMVFPERYTDEYKHVCKHNEIFVFEIWASCCDFCTLAPVFERIRSSLRIRWMELLWLPSLGHSRWALTSRIAVKQSRVFSQVTMIEHRPIQSHGGVTWDLFSLDELPTC